MFKNIGKGNSCLEVLEAKHQYSQALSALLYGGSDASSEPNAKQFMFAVELSITLSFFDTCLGMIAF